MTTRLDSAAPILAGTSRLNSRTVHADPRRLRTAVALAAGFGCSGVAAQSLTQLSDLTEAQSSLASAIHTVCPDLAAMPTRSRAQENLFIACNRMIHTANALVGSGATDNNLGINEEQLRMALGDIAHEEVLAHRRAASDTVDAQYASVATRLGALRQTVRSGASPLAWNGDDPLRGSADGRLNFVTGGAAGDGASAQRGWFVNGGVNFGDKDATSREDGFEFESLGVTAGMDWLLSDQNLLGVAAGYSTLESDVDDTNDVAESDGYSVALYGSRFAGDWYLDAVASFGSTEYDTLRDLSVVSGAVNNFQNANVLRSAISGSTEGEHVSLTLGAGREYRNGGFSWTPYGRLTYLQVDIDGYTEYGNSGLELQVGEQQLDSLEAVLGLDASSTTSLDAGVLNQQFLVEYHREFEDQQEQVRANYLYDPNKVSFVAPSDPTDEDYFVVGTGFTLVRPQGQQWFAYYETSIALEHISSHVVMVGYRGEF